MIEKLDSKILIVGENFRFGYQRKGTVYDLQHQSFEFIPFPLQCIHSDEKYSSSTLKDFIRRGDLFSVEHILGSNYTIVGHVAEGKKLGRTLGFPTMNIKLNDLIVPKSGLIACAKISTEPKNVPRSK